MTTTDKGKPEPRMPVKPCPFCAGTRLESLAVPDGKRTKKTFLYCKGCGASGPEGDSRQEAIDKWEARK